ncbi:glycoside hydrolase family 130 protein [Pyrococcus sp. ST04]|uniref:glycoside hydrolase family 130 protein n=1 Tax=Pyrococcus sp. ST04 TaxID=1183377 RepID=UPI0002605EA5|nr:glycoside hydrolase family 130 protein [Pyrococcus sp. ST04]AFK22593.1 putative Glycosidase [Pyrococcus sp. ST04]
MRKFPFPILLPSSKGFDSKNTYNPGVIYHRGKFVMLYRAEGDDNVTGRIGLAISEDGITFLKHPEPVLEPEYSWERRGVEDPRIVRIGKKFIMTYTGYDGRRARLCLATSKNLVSWKKHGPIFDEFPQTKGWTKSGAILDKKVNGRYIMYFGDSNIWIAYSKDGITWEFEDEPVLGPRKGMFDERLVEPGPPPILLDDKIILLYNSADNSKVYRVGIAVFSKDNPRKLIARTENPILWPEYSWERYGHVNNVVFLESIVVLKDRILLYYGAADKYVGMAIWPSNIEKMISVFIGP